MGLGEKPDAIAPTVVGDSIVEELGYLLGIKNLKVAKRKLHLFAAMAGLGYTEEEIVHRTGSTKRIWRAVSKSKVFEELKTEYSKLPERSIEIAKKLQAIGAPVAVAKLLATARTDQGPTGEKAAVDLLKSSGASTADRPVTVYIDQRVATLLQDREQTLLDRQKEPPRLKAGGET